MLLTTQEPREAIEAYAQAHGPWFYRFQFSNGAQTGPIVDENALGIHADRAAMIFPQLDRLFGQRWSGTRCLDIACHEGWFSLQLGMRGAGSVLGVDLRGERTEKAAWLAQTGGLGNVQFRQSDLFALDPQVEGTFDLVFFLGIFYHLENPMAALRRVRQLTKSVCVLEGQVARSVTLTAAQGQLGTEREGAGCVVLPADAYHAHETGGIVMIPSLPALQVMLQRAGFREIHLVLAPPDVHEQYRSQDRVIIFAYV